VGDFDARQAAIDEKRLWVRITRSCNNRCEFCLDSGALGGGPIPEDEVRARLRRGRDEGYTRLILSGGEATTHPKFLDFVKYGTEIGYSWIQVISNGRMFAYESFARQAVENGLREATLSMHAHNQELFERLTGAGGAFKQAVRGLVNLKRLGTVVSVDIVLTRLNLPYLREIMEFYISLGVMEFDLLHLIPFGRGFEENREELYADDAMIGRELARALELDRIPGMFIWTNRLPIRYLEGYEHLFQDPHKLYDEVLGERQSFRRLFADGTPIECRQPERCAVCFLRDFCDAAIRYAAGQWDSKPVPPATELDGALARRIIADGSRDAAGDFPDGLRIAVREHFGEARSVAPTVEEVREVTRITGLPVMGLPPCLGGVPSCQDAPDPGCVQRWPAPPPGILDARGVPEVAGFVGFYIRELYRVKSLRCESCSMNARCAGLQVNLARQWGLKVLTPVTE